MFNADICGESLSNSSIHSLEVHKDELKDIWQRVKPTYEARVQELTASADPDAKADLETIRARYETTYATYVDSKQKPSGNSYTNSDHTPNHFSIHLPPCDTELFHGDYLSWPAIYINKILDFLRWRNYFN